MRRINSFILLCFVCLSGFSQQKLTIDDVFTRPELNVKNIRGLQWIPGTHSYVWITDKGTAMLRASVEKETTDTILKPSDILPEMKNFVPLDWRDADHFSFNYKNGLYSYDLKEKKATLKCSIDETAENTDIEPKTLAVAFTKENNLFITSGDKTKNISGDGKSGLVYGTTVHQSEFGITKGTYWSPSGNQLAFYRMEEEMVKEYPIVHIGTFPATLSPQRYPMAGSASHFVTLGIYNVSSGKTIYVKTGEPKEQYLTNIAWSPDDQYILIAIVNRAQNEMKLNQYSAADGSFIKTLFTESDPQWVEPMHPAEFVTGKKDQFIWQSEKDGFNHLYLYDLAGKQLAQVTSGKVVVTEFLGFDNSGKYAFAEIADNNGLDRKLIKCDLKGKMTIITNESGSNTVSLCSDKLFFINSFSNLKTPRIITLNPVSGTNGKKELLKAENPLANYQIGQPELLNITASDGTILNGRIIKPVPFDPAKKYPVLVYLYGGSHAQLVSNRWLGGANLWMSWMASQGYIVFTMDNRGSEARGLEFCQITHRKLGVVEMEDQLKGIDYLKSLPYVDANRMGIHGWSFGGFMTTTMMVNNPGMFKAGVAGGPVIDWKLYEIMYTERYMDTPAENKDGYENANLLPKAKNLKDRLLMIHGTVDNVVMWQHSQEFVKKCVDEGVLIDYMIYPEHQHNVQGKDRLHLYKTVTRYLVEHLE